LHGIFITFLLNVDHASWKKNTIFFLTLASFFPMTHTSQKDCKWTLWAVPNSNLIGSWPKLWALCGYVSGQTRHQFMSGPWCRDM
jgi:hypothetical protein